MAQARAIPTVALPGEVAMPLVGLGSWQLRGRRAYDAVSFALEVGYRHVDTATVYGNEAEVGRALRGSGLPRQDVFLTTKLPPGSAGRERETLAASLRALGTDYVDLWLVHWPPGDRARPQTWRELLAIRDQGLARAVGVSNYSTSQLDELIDATGQAPAVNQIPWSPPRHDLRRLAAPPARRSPRGLQPAQGHPPRRPGADRDRGQPRGDARTGRPALASRARDPGHPQVGLP